MNFEAEVRFFLIIFSNVTRLCSFELEHCGAFVKYVQSEYNSSPTMSAYENLYLLTTEAHLKPQMSGFMSFFIKCTLLEFQVFE